MNSVFNLPQLLPIVISLVQLFIIIFLVLMLLRKLKILRLPFGGVEYGEAIFVSSIILASFLIAIADIDAIFQAYKNLDNRGEELLKPLLVKAGQFSIVVLFFILLLGLVVYLFYLLFGKLNKTSEKPINENIPLCILLAVVTIAFGLAFHAMVKDIIELLIPRYLNFR